MYPNEEYMKTAFSGVGHRLDGIQKKAVQGDLNQNDPSEPDYIKNRTHWVETKTVEIIPETTVTPEEVEVEGELVYLAGEIYGPITAFPQPGRHYILTLNGVTYEGEWKIVPDTGNTVAYGGNACLTPERAYFQAEDTGEPFGVSAGKTSETEVLLSVFTRSAEEVTVSLTTKLEVVHPLDLKFLPDELVDSLTGTYIPFDNLSDDDPYEADIASPGTSTKVARADHVHPKEVSDSDRSSWNEKLGVTSIVNNLTTNVASKVLSAAQGYELKKLVDKMNVPESSADDNGKVLSVVDGAPAWTITSAEQAAASAAEAATSAEQAAHSATVAQEHAQAMAGAFDFTGYLRYKIVEAAPETYDEGVLYIVTAS